MKVTALAGGVGGAKLLVGLQRVLHEDLTAIVNTGDDSVIYGVHVSPDVDIVTYRLAGIGDTDRGWGIRGDTFDVLGALRNLGHPTWFSLGDRDLATCMFRTMALAGGATLSDVTAEIATALGVRARVLPMSDDRVRTIFRTTSGETLEFQEYFVRERQEPEIASVSFEGIDDASPGPLVLDAIGGADLVVVCPSNPVVSIGPIVALPGIRDALRVHPRVVAVSPIVRGAPIKGPADKLLRSTGSAVSASGVAALYSDFCKVFVVDETDRDELGRIEGDARALDTIMVDESASERLARDLIAA